MGTMQYVEFDRADLARVRKAFGAAQKKTPQVIKNAVNRTATQVRKKIVQGGKSAYKVDKDGWSNKTVTIQRANLSHLNAIIESSGRTMTLMHFPGKSHTPGRGNTGAMAGVTGGVKEITSSGKKAFSFGGNGLAAMRQGADRFPIHILRSVSSPKIMELVWKGERGNAGDLDKFSKDELSKQIQKDIDKAFPNQG